MPMHILSQIDIEHKTAYCTVCGYTRIHVPENYEETQSRILCVRKRRELNLYSRFWRSLSSEERKLVRKERHSLTEIDPALHRAVCAICGPTDIYQYVERGTPAYRCATYGRLSNRSQGLRQFIQQTCVRDLLFERYQQGKATEGLRPWVDRTKVHLEEWPALHQSRPVVSSMKEASDKKKKRTEENSRLVEEYKRTHTCKGCGAPAQEPDELRFFEAHLPRKQIIARLIFKLDPERLVLELEMRDLYCPKCHYRVMRESAKRAQALRSAKAMRSTL